MEVGDECIRRECEWLFVLMIICCVERSIWILCYGFFVLEHDRWGEDRIVLGLLYIWLCFGVLYLSSIAYIVHLCCDEIFRYKRVKNNIDVVMLYGYGMTTCIVSCHVSMTIHRYNKCFLVHFSILAMLFCLVCVG